ncbi:response regulator transcription factor [Corynebacterium falsenii]|uniref:response regulator transcription factor n=1 Tax=Corynebacterium falsenii TaxID=108486 RepID=UPI001D41DF91|nr:response regulator transcription factor [Corynebacterium falsenii]HJF12469.1 response regulator transcription factor [Corynebacterium falsenii]
MNILLAEDSALLREAMVHLLSSLGHEVVTVEDAQQLLDHAEDPVDLIITDVRMPPNMSDDGLLAARRIREARPDQPVMMLSQYVAASYVDTLLEHGGFGYLLKDRVSNIAEFVAAMETVRTGGTVVDPEVVSVLLASKNKGITQLTPREREVLGLMAQGKSNAEIQASLVLTPGAVNKHVANVFTKLGFEPTEPNRRVRAVLVWLRHTGNPKEIPHPRRE